MRFNQGFHILEAERSGGECVIALRRHLSRDLEAAYLGLVWVKQGSFKQIIN